MPGTVNPTGKSFNAKATVKCDYSFGHVPLTTDDYSAGYSVGSEVKYSGQVYVCADNTTGSAVWNAAKKGDKGNTGDPGSTGATGSGITGGPGPTGASGILPQVDVTGTTGQMAVDTAYFITNAAQVVVTLPATAAKGTEIQIISDDSNAAGVKIAQNANQSMEENGVLTTVGTGGYVTGPAGCTVHLKCVVENTDWAVLCENGELTFA